MLPCYTKVYVPAGTECRRANNLPKKDGEFQYWVPQRCLPAAVQYGVCLSRREMIEGIL